jgi:6-pyruvoyltetrahydropterin/6-carboxytetrahydropterin synthase
MYEVGLSKSFRAWHVMPEAEGPEGKLHPHDYRLDVVIAREDLDARGMVCDLDVVEDALERAVAQVAGKDLELIRPAGVPAVTVEVLARWAHDQLCALVAGAARGRLSVRVWESPDAFGGYSGALASSS